MDALPTQPSFRPLAPAMTRLLQCAAAGAALLTAAAEPEAPGRRRPFAPSPPLGTSCQALVPAGAVALTDAEVEGLFEEGVPEERLAVFHEVLMDMLANVEADHFAVIADE